MRCTINLQGINLSGGQRQRVSIARAAYANADIYLLDSPLSAVDANVANHIFEKRFIQLLAGKTRILCTNQLQFLPQCDRVLELRCDGVRSYISEQGTYSELMAQQHSELSQLMATYSITTELCTTTDDDNSVDNSDDNSSSTSGDDVVTPTTAVGTATVNNSAMLPDSLVRFTEELQLHATLSRSHSSLREPSLLLMSAHSAHGSAELYDEYNEDSTATTTAANTSTTVNASTTVTTSCGDAVVAGARLVQDETIATGHVQWQVYKTYFKEGSGGTLLQL
jgi:ABC-type sulfate/molybdate transport systems ATPase subunit